MLQRRLGFRRGVLPQNQLRRVGRQGVGGEEHQHRHNRQHEHDRPQPLQGVARHAPRYAATVAVLMSTRNSGEGEKPLTFLLTPQAKFLT